MTIGIVGVGVVGQATARCWMEWDEVRCFDIIEERSTHNLAQVLDSDIVFLCLPTSVEMPMMQTEKLCQTMAMTNKPGAVIRSSLPIGATDKLRRRYSLDLIHYPEFLTARCAIADAQIPARNVVGGPATPMRNKLVEKLLHRFPHVPIHIMSSTESEATKLYQNSFFAVKIAFWNEVFKLTQSMDMDWEKIRNAILADGRIHPSHTQVPGPDGHHGFGGACLPKDISILSAQMLSIDVTPFMCSAAIVRNLHDRDVPT